MPLDCRTARLLWQAPGELAAADALRLRHHLGHCSRCREMVEAHRALDGRLTGYLDTATPAESGRADVLARLGSQSGAVQEAAPLRRSLFVRPRLWLAGPIVALSAVVALMGSHPLSAPDGALSPAGAMYHFVRPQVGFPLAVDAAREGHLLAGSSGGVYETWNSGNSWRRLAPLGANLVIRAVAVDRAIPGHYLVATAHSVFVSRDAGRHWNLAASNLPGAMNMFLVQDARTPSTFYVGPSVLWKSIDGGEKWFRAGPGTIFAPDGIQSLSVTANGSLLTAIWAGGVARSTDGGRTWHSESAGLARDAMDVAASRDGSMWAATDQGVFIARHSGRWFPTSLPRRFFVTSIAVARSFTLAGGNGFLYRTSDGGRNWQPVMDDLPPDPYVSDLQLDPSRPQRVYASLDGDGLFRSDDAGRHWTAINRGLPMQQGASAAPNILFRRTGVLWITDAQGSDPEALTVDRDVHLAALAPDRAAAVYVAATGDRWAMKVLGAGGSAAQSLLAGTGVQPGVLLWSPDAARVATQTARSIHVAAAAAPARSWSVSPSQQLAAWTADGRGLILWSSSTGLLQVVDPSNGRLWGEYAVRFPHRPALSPNSALAADASHGMLRIDAVRGLGEVRVHVGSSCRVLSWAPAGKRILLRCGRYVEERTPRGSVAARVLSPGPTSWLPGSSTALLSFRRGDLWTWTPRAGARLLVRNAAPFPDPLSLSD